MITLGTLKNEFASFLVNQTIATRMSDWVYWVLMDIVSSNEYWWNKKVGTFSTTSGTAQYFLNHRVNMRQLKAMFDTTNNSEIKERSLEWIYTADPTPTETGTPKHWAYVNQANVQAVATTGAIVSVASSSASDTNISVRVSGKVSGIERTETITTNGTNSVSGTLVWDAGEISSIVLASVCAGVLTATSNSTTIVSIPPGYLRVQCPLIRLYLVPGGTYSISYIFYQRALKPVSDSDIIEIPDEAHKALRYGLEEIGHFNNGDIDFSIEANKKYEFAKKELWKWSNRNLNTNEIKDYTPTIPVAFRLPETISYTPSA